MAVLEIGYDIKILGQRRCTRLQPDLAEQFRLASERMVMANQFEHGEEHSYEH